MAQLSVTQRIVNYNAGRDQELLSLKYKLIRDNVFSFYRGTCHLFYEDWPLNSALNKAPLAWICGDLHLENFGSYKGDNRLTYFDLNDFDEAVLAPCTWELARFLVSVLVAAESLRLTRKQAHALCETFLQSYIKTLGVGAARWVERANATGMVKDLLASLKKRTRADFIKDRVETKRGIAKLSTGKGRALPVSDEARQKVMQFMTAFAQIQPNPAFFEVVDVARRVAGTGSLGMERYAILVRGDSNKATQYESFYLLDLKLCATSALMPYLPKNSQPKWASEAARVVTVQRNLQAVPPAFLSAVSIGQQSYVLKELLPTQDRLSLVNAKGKMSRLTPVIEQMGVIVAWAQLRASGRQGAAIADNLIAFAHDAVMWQKPLMEYVQSYASHVSADWQTFCKDKAVK